MGHRELTMTDVQEILRRFVAGEPVRAIARATSTDRKTVRRYLEAARAVGVVPGGAAPTTEQVLAAARARRAPPRRDESDRDRALLGQTDRIRTWLFRDELTLTKVGELLTREGLAVPYSSLRRFARAHCDFTKHALTVRLADPPPGQEAQVDFGRLGYLNDSVTERRRLAYAFVLVLAYSRHQFVDVVFDQKVETVIGCFERAWVYFGGVVAYVIPDNLKSVVTRPDRYDPIINRSFKEYALHRGFLVDPAPPRHATGKARVERPIPYVRERFFRGESFLDREDCQDRALRWCSEVAGRRIHGTTHRRPIIVFEEEEKATLKPLSPEPFDVPAWGTCKVHPDHHVRFLQALYSLPSRFVGLKVEVRADSRLVRIYRGPELVKTHPRKPKGKRSTDYDDYPKELSAYARRNPDYCIQKAKECGDSVGRFMERLLEGPFPWAKLRLAQKCLRLADTYGRSRLETACERALSFDVIDVFRVEAILEQALEKLPPHAAASDQRPPLGTHFLREPKSFVNDVH